MEEIACEEEEDISFFLFYLQSGIAGSRVTSANLIFEVFSDGTSLAVSGTNITKSLVMQGMVPGLSFKGKELLAARGSLGVAVQLQMHPVLTTAIQGMRTSLNLQPF